MLEGCYVRGKYNTLKNRKHSDADESSKMRAVMVIKIHSEKFNVAAVLIVVVVFFFKSFIG